MIPVLLPPRTTTPRSGAIASLIALLAALSGCDGDNYYPGEPLSKAAIAVTAFALPESASTTRIVYTARWRILDDDFRRYPYLLELKSSSTGQHIDIHPASPADSATGMFVCPGSACNPGQLYGTMFAELEKGKLLSVGYTFATVSR